MWRGMEKIPLLARMRAWWADYQWILIGLLAISSFVLGAVGYGLQLSTTHQHYTEWDLIYRSLHLFSLDFEEISIDIPWQLEVARLLSPSLLMFTALSALLGAFRNQSQLFRLRWFRGHVVICGLGEKGYLLASNLRRKRSRVVAIELDASNGRIEQARDLGIIVLLGNATDCFTLVRARVPYATKLIAVTGDEGANAEIATRCRTLLDRRKSRGGLDCFVHISDPDLADLLDQQKFDMKDSDRLRLEIFNIYTTGARAMLNNFPAWPETSDSSAEAPHQSTEPPYPAVIGLGRLGRAFVVELSRQWSIMRSGSDEKLPVLLIDPKASEVKALLESTFWRVREYCILDALDRKTHDPNPLDDEWLKGPTTRRSVSHIYVCLNDDARALSLAFRLRRKIKGQHVPIVVRTLYGFGLGSLVESEKVEDAGTGRIQVFSLYDHTCTHELLQSGTFETIAHAIHDDYVRQQRCQGQTPGTNPSMVPWHELPETLRNSSRRQAHHIRVKLDAIGCSVQPQNNSASALFQFSDDEIRTLARLEHKRWMDERIADGWSYSPEEKSLELKTSPYLISWDNLPESIKEIDRKTVRNLPTFLAKVGFEIVRCDALTPLNSSKTGHSLEKHTIRGTG
jgi:TrkA-N domain/RyR domain